MTSSSSAQQLSIVHGAPLLSQPGMGSLSIPGYLKEVTSRYGDSEALVMHLPSSTERWSYRTLWEKSIEVAKALVACGIGKDSRVGILMTNRPEYLSALFGTAMAGGVSVALSTFSTVPELDHLIRVSGISVLLFEGCVLKKDFGAYLADLEPQLSTTSPGQLQSSKFPFLRHLVRLSPVTNTAGTVQAEAACFESWNDFLARGGSVTDSVIEARAASVTPSDAGGLFFSSGTTSLPKGILHAQRAFAIQWWRWPHVMSVEGAVRSWTGNGFFWSGNITMVVGVALSTGGAVILQPYFEAEEALKLIEEERISFVSGRPHQWARLQEAPNWKTADLGSLRYITNSALLEEHSTVKKSSWHLPMSFGTTETMTINTSYTANTSTEQYAGSAGVPLPGNILKIIDPETSVVVPRGQRGEICIKGPTLMMAYIGKSIEDTLDDEGYFRTGDGGYVDEIGRLYWEGRLTEIIKTGGANVSPLEVDEHLSQYPGVRRAQTIGLPHKTLSEVVVSCIVPQDGVELDEASIYRHLREHLASFKIPRHILILRDDEVAVTGNGKVKLNELRQLASQRLSAADAAITAGT